MPSAFRNRALDDRTLAYVIAAHPVFEDLRQVAAQLAGLLVLAATGSKETSPDQPMLESAKLACVQAADGVNRAGALTSDHTRAHHRKLVDARAALADALASADTWPVDVEAVLLPLRMAYAHLQSASQLLPGFQMVSFEQACCGNNDQRRARQAR